MNTNKHLKVLLTVFVLIIIGVVLFQQIGTTNREAVTTQAINNESVTTVSDAVTLANDDIISITYFGNGTNDYSSYVDVMVNVTTSTGAILVASNFTDGAYNVSYGYYPDTYVHDSASRVILPLNTLFFALFIVFIGFLAIANLKDYL